ncbi:homoserine kinase [Paenibacillus senegalensis]|uniref:homoserine kinase n=1 Tax=Paenibacillus senegalensis TaxID=1465766 RepID=UPI0003148898|nr:homoserine kinase [Paenibacillus senegalensis]
MKNVKIRVQVPASTANLGPGFDCLGMALDLYAWIDMKPAEQTVIQLYGEQMKQVAADKSNLIYKAAQMVFQEAGAHCPELEIAAYSDIPLTRGLGSSASAIIGAMTAANQLLEAPLPEDKLFQMASAMEKHPDNVGASLFGGIIVAFWDGVLAKHIRLEPLDRLEVLVVIPEFHLATEKARNILPEEVSMKDAVFNVGHSSLLAAALAEGRYDLIPYAMKDVLHQPYRASLIPGMAKILEQAGQYGALGTALSGAGPTLLTLVDSQSTRKPELEQFLISTLKEENLKASTLWLKPAKQGVRAWVCEANEPPLYEINQSANI